MNHQAPSLNILRHVRAGPGLAIRLVLAFAHGYPVSGLATQQGDGAAAKPSSECSAPSAIDRLICAEPSLAVLDTTMDAAFREHRDRAVRPAEREARPPEQRLWLDGRARACPAATPASPDAPLEAVRRESAFACLSRIYEQRLAVLGYERNAAGWPRVRFRPTLLEGAGIKLCEDLLGDLVASFSVTDYSPRSRRPTAPATRCA
jgi:uncharacterized protein